MELEEDHPSNNRNKKSIKIYAEYDNIELLQFLYCCSSFSRDYYSNVLFKDVPFKAIQIFHDSEKRYSQQQNPEILVSQVNMAESNIANPRSKLNTICTVNTNSIYCNDIRKILALKKYRFNITKQLYNEIVSFSQQSKFYIFVNDFHNVKQQDRLHISNLFYCRKTRYLRNGEPNDMKIVEKHSPRESCLLHNDIQRNFLNIRLEQQGIDFRISLCKYSLPQIFYTLIQMCNSCIQLPPDSAAAYLFSPAVGYWYFQDIGQGYLLKLLLRNVNVSSLSVMSQLYFVLITRVYPNLNIQVNYKRKPELLAIHESLILNKFIKSVDWCKEHRRVLKSIYLHFPSDYIEERPLLTLPCAASFTKPELSQIELIIQVVDYEEHPQNEHGYNIMDWTSRNEDEDSMILPLLPNDNEYNIPPSESEFETKEKLLLLPSASYKKYSDIFNLESFEKFEEIASTNSTENLYVLHDKEKLKKSFITPLSVFFSCAVSSFSFRQSKLWKELGQKLDTLKEYLNSLEAFDCHAIHAITEPVFEGASVNLYEKYCKAILNQHFVSITLQNLGKSLGNILFNIN